MKNKKPLWVLGQKVTLHQSTGNYDLAIIETPPESQGPPPHDHSNYDEFFSILEGEMEFMVNGEKIVLKAGDSLDVPSGKIHTFQNVQKHPCKWISVHSPKGFSDFFTDFGIPSEDENAVQKSVDPTLVQKVIQTAASYDMNIAPPPST